MGKNTLTDTLADVIATLPTTDLGALDAVQLMRRFDTKYVVPETWLPDLIASMGDYAHVLSVDGEAECRYDNLYYELPGDRFLQDHLRGKARRMKIRKRHYTSNDLAFLEVKERLPGGRTVKERIATSSNISPNFSPNTCWKSIRPLSVCVTVVLLSVGLEDLRPQKKFLALGACQRVLISSE